MENLFRKTDDLSNVFYDNNLFGGFEFTSVNMGEDFRYEFKQFVSADKTKCVLVLPKSRFIDAPRCVWLILDKFHATCLNPLKVSPWFTSPNNQRSVLISQSDFVPEKIRRNDDGFSERGVDIESDESLTYKYWLSQADNNTMRPWLNAYGCLYL